MTPYNIPEELLNHITVGDAAQLLKLLPDECIDFTITSPPYDNLRSYNGYVFDFETIVTQLYRVTKTGGVVVWVVDDKKEDGRESGTSLRQAIRLMDIGFFLHDKMIYESLNGAMGAPDEYLQCFEMMFVLSKGRVKTFNPLYDRVNVRFGKESTPKTKRSTDGTLAERIIVDRKEYGRRKNIWQYAVGGKQEIGDHPAIFPEDLAKDHILSWSNAGDVVLDPLCGSGTTCKEAKELGRNWIGFEISEEYAKDAIERVYNARTPLFVL